MALRPEEFFEHAAAVADSERRVSTAFAARGRDTPTSPADIDPA
jgi:hypothetical protein